ncbi:MAG: ABC transporter permease [Firmicutes bacterium]|nr:ABC transporter permease [Bacillota bacterium]
MRLEYIVAKGHITRRWRQNLALLISVGLGVCAIIAFLSVANGFQKDLTERVLGLTSHVVVLPLHDRFFHSADGDMQSVLLNESVIGAAPSLLTHGLITFQDSSKSIQVKGIVPEAEAHVSPVLRSLPGGSITDLTYHTVLLGRGVKEHLHVRIDDVVLVTLPNGTSQSLTVVGFFDSGVLEYDDNYVYAFLPQIQDVLNLKQQFGEIRVAVKDPLSVDAVKAELHSANPNLAPVTWKELNRNLFDALVLEKRVFAFALSLLLVVAGFGIANVLGMHVMQRRKDIAILSTMGLSLRRIRLVFILQAVFLGIVGVGAGGVMGLLISKLIDMFGLPLPGDMYPVTEVPVHIKTIDVCLTVLGGLAICLIAGYIPARRISSTSPGEVLSYE